MAEELFDIYDEQMNPIGQATRAETHAKGYWHETFHCWLTRREGNRRFVRFQLRQSTKDTNPGCYDITAAGHLAAGETVEHAVRELEEELGVRVPFDELVQLFAWREEAEGMTNGVPFIDRELSRVFGLVWDAPLSEHRLQHSEVAGIFEAELEHMLQLFEGSLDAAPACGYYCEEEGLSSAEHAVAVHASQFVPRDPAYYIDVLRLLQTITP